MLSWDTAWCVPGGGGEAASRRWWLLGVYICVYIYIYICRWVFSNNNSTLYSQTPVLCRYARTYDTAVVLLQGRRGENIAL